MLLLVVVLRDLVRAEAGKVLGAEVWRGRAGRAGRTGHGLGWSGWWWGCSWWGWRRGGGCRYCGGGGCVRQEARWELLGPLALPEVAQVQGGGHVGSLGVHLGDEQVTVRGGTAPHLQVLAGLLQQGRLGTVRILARHRAAAAKLSHQRVREES